jgi:2'-5' RNA ligase
LIRRIFIAIPAPPEISTYLEQLKEDNQKISGIKWMRFNNLHLTIYFIGNVKDEDFEKIVDAIRPIINSKKKITLDFEKIAFAPVQNPKMIWARFHKNSAFTQLVNSLHDALNSIVPESKFYYKEPVPHITLARFHPLKEFEKINIERPLELSQIIITTCELMESIPSPTGVTYKKAAPYFNLDQ